MKRSANIHSIIVPPLDPEAIKSVTGTDKLHPFSHSSIDGSQLNCSDNNATRSISAPFPVNGRTETEENNAANSKDNKRDFSIRSRCLKVVHLLVHHLVLFGLIFRVN